MHQTIFGIVLLDLYLKVINDYLVNITLTKENKSKIKVLSDATDINRD